MIASKGFDKNLQCRGFQYEIGKEYEEDKAELCECGFHSCLNPFDVFKYYAPANGRFCEVEIPDDYDRSNKDSKVVSKKIKILKEVSLIEFINKGIEFNRNENNDELVSSKIGDYSTAVNAGGCSTAVNTGSCSIAVNTGGCSTAVNTGNYSVATTTGYRSAATNTGDYSTATNTSDYSTAITTGDYSTAVNAGNCSYSIVTGQDSIAIATGYEGKAKGSSGNYLVLTERDDDYHIADVQLVKIDGEKIKADTFYMLKNGNIVEII